jgi:hypothetical protein
MNTGVNTLGAVDGASFEEAKHKLVFCVFDAVGDDNIEVPHRERKVIAGDQYQSSNLAPRCVLRHARVERYSAIRGEFVEPRII